MNKRIIKFRCWDKENKKMLDQESFWVEVFNDDLYVKVGGTSYSKEDVELMQFTGLLDKNGREIYEGDIMKCITGVSFHHTDAIEIGWSTGQATNDGYGLIWSKTKDLILDQDSIDQRYEVIGNIFETPELLT